MSLRQQRLFLTLVLISTLGQISADLYLPSLPALALHFNVTTTAAKLTVTFFMLGYSFSPLLYGPWSDGIGRRKPYSALCCVIYIRENN